MNWLKKISMPLTSDYLENLHDPDIRSTAPKNTQIEVFHGTTIKRLIKILQHGSLDPGVTSAIEHKSYPDASQGIFVTTSLGLFGAELYAHHASQGDKDATGDGSDTVVLSLVVPLNWLEPDPDDSRLTPEGKPNQASMTQARIMRPINVKRIKMIAINNPILSQKVPYGRDNIFDAEKTAFTPIGKMLDIITRTKNLPEEYYQLTGSRPRGMARSEVYEDQEQWLAMKLTSLYQSYYGSFYSSIFDKTLAWVYKNKVHTYDMAQSRIMEYLAFMGKTGDEVEVSDFVQGHYAPKPTENLRYYFGRV